MKNEEFMDILVEKSKKLQINIDKGQAEKFYNYMNLLLEWNEKMNLTAITDNEEIISKHFIDSLSILRYVNQNDRILDIGTGAGFPGIPLKIVLENNECVLLDSLNKRISFLNCVIDKINLKKITANHDRAEDFIKKIGQRNSFDIVVSRAVAKLNVLLEYMLPYTKIGGKCICMKSYEIEEEIEEAKRALEILGGKIDKIEEITLPDTEIKRKIIIIEKIKETPTKYPRKAGIPKKEPIK